MPEYGSDATGGASYRNSAGALSIALDRVYNEALLPESVNFRYFIVVTSSKWRATGIKYANFGHGIISYRW